jgi:hypothetical protein
LQVSRRWLCSALGGFCLGGNPAWAQLQDYRSSPHPNSQLFQSGDLLWPKPRDALVLYNQSADSDPNIDKMIWENERQEFIAQVGRSPMPLSRAQVSAIGRLSYEDFCIRYFADQNPDQISNYSSEAGLYVGHVGIVTLDEANRPYVVEALWKPGVVRQPYSDWIAGRSNDFVWLGRLRNASGAERSLVASEAVKYIGRPYNFWNFDLGDASDFYCSKLVWLSAFRALGLAIDGNNNPVRGFWLSPKQLLSLPAIEILHRPGSY